MRSIISRIYQYWIQAPLTRDLANDCFRFVTALFQVISISAPHIYHSALALSPKTSRLRGLYQQYIHPLIWVVHGAPTAWGPVLATIHPPPDTIPGHATFSPRGRFIALIWRDREMGVQILDAVTLKRLGFFEGHPGFFTFSPEGRSLMGIATFPEPRFTILDLQTGIQNVTCLQREQISQPPVSVTYSRASLRGFPDIP